MAEKKLSSPNYFLQLLTECDFIKVHVLLVYCGLVEVSCAITSLSLLVWGLLHPQVQESKNDKNVSWSEKWLAERKKTFAKECKEILGKDKTGELSLKRFTEEYCRVYKRQLICADYGYKKLQSLMENVAVVEACIVFACMSINTT